MAASSGIGAEGIRFVGDSSSGIGGGGGDSTSDVMGRWCAVMRRVVVVVVQGRTAVLCGERYLRTKGHGCTIACAASAAFACGQLCIFLGRTGVVVSGSY